jgi:trehalose 2-sulfotransferase
MEPRARFSLAALRLTCLRKALHGRADHRQPRAPCFIRLYSVSAFLVITAPMTTLNLRGYAICSEPRSGTTYLTRLLASTGELGHPREFFKPDNAVGRTVPGFGPKMMIDTVLTHGATPNGVYALKVFTGVFDNPAEPWCCRLPNLQFVHVERLDALGQAISMAKAIQTGQYLSTEKAVGPPRYDSATIAYFLVQTARRQARWRMFFARNDIVPLRLTYEYLSSAPLEAVAQVGQLVGVADPRVDHSLVETSVQRDALSVDWRARFVREHGDLSRLDSVDIGPILAIRRTLSRARQKLFRLSGGRIG